MRLRELLRAAHEIKVDAETLLGEFLAKAEKAGPAHSKGGGSKGSKREPLLGAPPTLSVLGLSKKESSEAQLLAKLKADAPEQHAAVHYAKKARLGEESIQYAHWRQRS